jgi:hypothetical protein
MLITVAVVLFAIAASFGATMATMHFLGRTPPPTVLVLLHAVFVVSALAVLLGAVWPDFRGGAAWALGVFAVAALGGFTLALGFHARGKPLPSALVLGHGGLALVAFAILLAAAFA